MDKLIKFLEKLVDFLNYLKIMASPTLIGAFIGLVVYANKTDDIGLYIAICITIFGIVCGVLLANSVKKKTGTTEFMARINASPDIDDAIKKQNDKNTNT